MVVVANSYRIGKVIMVNDQELGAGANVPAPCSPLINESS